MRNAIVAFLLVGMAAAPAAADWLVTRDGSRIETRGPWELKGKLVVFTAANGTLSSLRLSEVDLEASEAATNAAKAPPPDSEPEPAPPEDKEPVLVITDADVPKARKREPQAPSAAEEGEAEAAEPQVTVVSWTEVNEPGSFDVRIFGTLRNDTGEVATDLDVMVRLLSSDGALLSQQPARLQSRNLAPGATTNFRAVFPGVYSFSSVAFEVGGNRMKLQAPEEPETEEEGA